MIDTVIVSGGNVERDFALDFLEKLIKKEGRETIRLIAADKGLEFFMETGLEPDLVVGDFDSLSKDGLEYLKRAECKGNPEIIRLKPEKDDSDTQSALNLAAGRGAKEVLLFGATGTRLDHVMANLGLLSLGTNLGLHISIMDANNYITLLKSGTVLKRAEQFGKYVSFFPVGGDVKGLTLEGFKYPLNDYHLTAADSGLTVSNEFAQDEAKVTYSDGCLLMIMSRD